MTQVQQHAVTKQQEETHIFRTTALSHIFMSGFIRDSLGFDNNVPLDIMHIITQYLNFYFFKLNYSIHDEKNNQKIGVYATGQNKTIRDITSDIEHMHFGNNSATRRVYLWSRLDTIETWIPIYDEKNVLRLRYCEKTQQNCPNRWVEIPNNYEGIKVQEFDQMTCCLYENVEDDNFEIGVEILDASIQQWPYRTLPFGTTRIEVASKPFSGISRIGKKLFLKIQEMQPKYAAKITGMLLEGMPTSDLMHLLKNPDHLRQTINEAMVLIFRWLNGSNKDTWIEKLKIGDIIDVRDHKLEWYEAVVRSITANKDDRIVFHIHHVG